MHSEAPAGIGRSVCPRSVQQPAVMKRAAGTFQFDVNFACLVNLFVANLHVNAAADDPRLIMIEYPSLMAARKKCETTILDRCGIERRPAGHKLRGFDGEVC